MGACEAESIPARSASTEINSAKAKCENETTAAATTTRSPQNPFFSIAFSNEPPKENLAEGTLIEFRKLAKNFFEDSSTAEDANKEKTENQK
ncbi:hypothetical protein [Bdellovibrio sp. NC01]|uniref:hypothetical protein n=1 Tax=Bdellovibrio sp. NC01 TaxID=2220073 RepID=UPI0011581A84|nr:hypothetical protein [Bdellovibrio sp. NC01]